MHGNVCLGIKLEFCIGGHKSVLSRSSVPLYLCFNGHFPGETALAGVY